MRAFAWLLVALGPVIGVMGTLMAREETRAWTELCRQSRAAACFRDGTAYAVMGWSIAASVIAFGILLLAIRRPEPRERHDDYLRRSI